MAFSPDGRRVGFGRWDGTLPLWDVRTGEELRTLRSAGVDPYGVYGLAFSPDGRWIAATANDLGAVTVWDAATYQVRHTLPAPPGGGLHAVARVAFSPD